jgi:hypothetical protein
LPITTIQHRQYDQQTSMEHTLSCQAFRKLLSADNIISTRPARHQRKQIRQRQRDAGSMPSLANPGRAGANEQKPTVSPPVSSVKKVDAAKLCLTLIALPAFLRPARAVLGTSLCRFSE